MYKAERTEGSVRQYLTAYRNGTGRVVFLQSTLPAHKPEKFSYVPKHTSEYRLFREFVEVGLQSQRPLHWRANVLEQHGITEMTRGQRSPEWFLLRKFRVTRTVASVIVHASVQQFNIDEELLFQSAGIQVLPEPNTTAEYDDYQFLSEAELMQKRKEDLVKACRAYNRPCSGNKPKLVQEIRMGPHIVPQRNPFKNVLRAWFMKPVTNRVALKLGQVNEDMVMRGLPSLFQRLRDPIEFGLLVRNEIATSVDGYVEIKLPEGEVVHCAVEIKTMASVATEGQRENVMLNGDKFVQCDFGTEIFFKYVFTTAYRLQVLHHAVAMNVDHVLFVVANSNTIMYGVLVHFVVMTYKP